MAIVQPTAPQADIDDRVYQVNITIPQARGAGRWGAAGFLLLWLGGWVFGEVFAIYALTSTLRGGAFADGSAVFAEVFLLVWLTGWTFGGLMAGSRVIMLLFGREEITANSDELTVHRRPIGRQRRYLAADINDLRFDDGTKSIEFDHGAKTVRFGSGLEEAELREIAELLRERMQLNREDGW